MVKLDTSDNKDIVFRVGFVNEAQSAGVEFNTLEMLVYERLRYYETEGKFKLGYSVAGLSDYAEAFGVDEKSIQDTFSRLAKVGLVAHVYCDKRVYRNKTRLWISVARLSQSLNTKQAIDAIKIVGRGGKKPDYMLGKNGLLSSATDEESSVTNELSSVADELSSVADELGIEKRPLMEKGLRKDLERIKNKERKKVSKTISSYDTIFEKMEVSSDLKEAFLELIKSRKLNGNKMTDKALELAIKNVRRLDENEANQIAIVYQSVENGWKGLFPLKEQNQSTNKSQGYNTLAEKLETTPEVDRAYDFWKKWLGVSCAKDNANVQACKDLLDDVGEDGLQKLIVALAFRSETLGFVIAEVSKIVDFVGLSKNRLAVQNFYNNNWRYWQRVQKAKITGKNVWEV